MATISYVVNAVDSASATFARIAGSADELLAQLDELGAKTANARVGLEGDEEAKVALDDIDLKLARLGKRVASPNVKVEGLASARLGLDRLNLQLDRINHKHVTATVDVDVNRGGLRGLLRSVGGAAVGEEGVFGGTGGFLSSPLGLGALGGGALIAAGLIPGLAGLGLGGLAGAGAFGGGLFGAETGKKVIKADQELIKQITTALKSAVGKQKAELHQSLMEANKQFTKDMTFFAPFLAFQGALKNLGRVFLAPLRPIMEPLTKIIQNFGAVLKTLGPQITGLFRASLPFIKQFAQLMLTSGDILIPAFTQALNQMVKSGALKIMTDSLVVLVRGLGKFIEALGPGMKASAEMFSRLMTFFARALPVVGKIFSDVAKFIMSDWSPAHLWNKLLDSAKAFWHAVVDSFHAFWHVLASSFDAFRHDIASIWDTIWRNTVTRARNGINDVIGWFKSLPRRAIGALYGLGHNLYAFARAALGDFLSGFKSLAGTVLGWISNFVKNIWSKVKSFFGINSPSSLFYDIGKNLMLGLFHGIKDHAHKAQNAWGGAIGALGGPGSASALQAQAYARSRLGAFGWGAGEMGALIALWNRESGWNRLARNPTSGAYGIPQALPPGKMGAAANPPTSSAAAQINWGLSYIAARYGSPSGAWGHEMRFGWYDRGGWLPPGLSLAYNTTGAPERVGGSGSTYNIHIGVLPGGEREAGRRIVEAIKRYEQGAGSRWRS